MKKFLIVIRNIFRGILRVCLFFGVVAFREIVKALTYERGKEKEITVRKAKRIRALSKFKIKALNSMPKCVNEFIGTENYKEYLNKHLWNGLQLRNYGTNKRAV